MGDEIKIGKKAYKLEEFYKLNNSEFKKIYEYVMELEKDLIKKIGQGKISYEQYINSLKDIQKVRNQLYEVEFRKFEESTKKVLNTNRAETVDEIDETFNRTLDNLSSSYDKIRNQVSKQIGDIQDEKDKILAELLASAPSKDLSPDDKKLVNEIIEEYNEKTSQMNILDNCISKLSNEQEKNIQVLSNQYTQKEVGQDLTKSKGLFGRIKNFVSAKKV